MSEHSYIGANTSEYCGFVCHRFDSIRGHEKKMMGDMEHNHIAVPEEHELYISFCQRSVTIYIVIPLLLTKGKESTP